MKTTYYRHRFDGSIWRATTKKAKYFLQRQTEVTGNFEPVAPKEAKRIIAKQGSYIKLKNA